MKIEATPETIHSIHHLIGYTLVCEYTVTLLLQITDKNLTYMLQDIGSMHEDLELTRDDMKEAWKQALTRLIYDGTLINGELPLDVHCAGMDLIEAKLHALIDQTK